MKTINITYWVATIILGALMLMSGVMGILNSAESAAMMHGQLGYPLYFAPYLSVAKILGVIALFVPGFPRVREWAYAGFTFDLLSAIYSSVQSGIPVAKWAPIVVFVVILAISYIYWHKKMSAAGRVDAAV